MALTQKDRDWIEGHFKDLYKAVTENTVNIAVLKTKAGVWGIIGGLIPVLIMIAILVISKWG